MLGGGELTLCPWGGYGRGPFRTGDGRYYCLDHKTGMTYWLSLEPPAHVQAEAARLAGKRRPWDKKPADADADAKRPKLNTEGGGGGGAGGEEGTVHLAFEMPASTSVRVGESFQARVPCFAPPATPAAPATPAEYEERGDELVEIEFSPLTSPPKRKLPPEPLAAAAAAASADAQAADAAAQAAADEEDARLREELEADPDDALAAIGLAVGDTCLAWGLNAGTRRQFKALLLTTRNLFPPLLVRYLADAQGVRNPLMMPDVPTAHLRTSEVTRWREPPPAGPVPTRTGEADSQGGGSSGEDGAEVAVVPSVPRKSLRDRSKAKPTFASTLATEAHGISLHLDPRCVAHGYAGTGYKGAPARYLPHAHDHPL